MMANIGIYKYLSDWSLAAQAQFVYVYLCKTFFLSSFVVVNTKNMGHTGFEWYLWGTRSEPDNTTKIYFYAFSNTPIDI